MDVPGSWPAVALSGSGSGDVGGLPQGPVKLSGACTGPLSTRDGPVLYTVPSTHNNNLQWTTRCLSRLASDPPAFADIKSQQLTWSRPWLSRGLAGSFFSFIPS